MNGLLAKLDKDAWKSRLSSRRRLALPILKTREFHLGACPMSFQHHSARFPLWGLPSAGLFQQRYEKHNIHIDLLTAKPLSCMFHP